MTGTVIKSTGSNYLVRNSDDGAIIPCKIRGKLRLDGNKSTNPVAVGDVVDFSMDSDDKVGVISNIQKRQNCIVRRATNLSRQSQVIAANIDQCLIVTTLIMPETPLEFIDRFLVSAEAYKVPPIIVFNKCDLCKDEGIAEELQRRIDIYTKIGYKCHCTSSVTGEGIDTLRELLRDKTTLLSGRSGVGKSTLLSVVSRAHPKIANYHFTTLFPNLGVVYVSEGVSFVMADIPGIIEGASEGAGLGHDFLRHIDRCRLLVHLVDVSGSEGRDPVDDFEAICNELHEYSPELADRPQIVAANKCDLLGEDRENIERLKRMVEASGYEFFEMSAVTHEGTRELVRECARRLAELPPISAYEADYVPPEPVIDTSEDLEIRQFDDMWIVEGPWLQRLVATVNFSDYESRMFFDRVLREAGVFERMEQMGVKDGDTVSMYDLMFEYKD